MTDLSHNRPGRGRYAAREFLCMMGGWLMMLAACAADDGGVQYIDPANLPDGVLKRQVEALSGEALDRAEENLRAEPLSNLRWLQVDSRGAIVPLDPPAPPPPGGTNKAPRGPLAPLTNTFFLHSRPGSTHKLYLDFDGHTTTNTVFNETFTTNEPIVSEPFDPAEDGPAISGADQQTIQYIWQRVAEDYAPFDIDVTTEEPGLDALRKTAPDDDAYGIRVVVSPTWEWFGSVVGGYAYLGSFVWDSDTPCFVFQAALYSTKQWAECCSHESGHSFGLVEDGTSSVTYYAGHASATGGWAPIMGNAYTRPLSQWSKGEYYDANNTEDDAERISCMTGYRPDDHANNFAEATPLAVSGGTTVTARGVIETGDDFDLFCFQCGSGTVNIAVNVSDAGENPDSGANVDMYAMLCNSNGTSLHVSDWSNQKYANINYTVPRGKYYLWLTGVSSGSPTNNPPSGYTWYGCIGQYSVTGTVPAYVLAAPAVDNGEGAAALPGLRRGMTLRGYLAKSGADCYVYWGTTDGGATKAAWQSVTALGARMEGALATNLYGFLYGARYYYRLYASNSAGTAWAPATATFALARPPEPVLPVTNGLALWLDASAIAGLAGGQQVDTWNDLSGAGNNALRDAGSVPGYPQYATNQLNGRPVVRFDSTGESWMGFNNMRNIRTVFWVLKETSPDRHFLLGDDGEYHFHRNGNGSLWDGTHAAANVRDGTTKLMGAVVDGTSTDLGSGYRLVSLVTAGNAEASRICNDMAELNSSWDGDIAEILIYNRPLDAGEEQAVGGYLTCKYALAAGYIYAAARTYGISNMPVSNVLPTGAVFNARLDAVDACYQVRVYWNTSDGGTNAAAWVNSAPAAGFTNVAGADIGAQVGGLAAGTRYYFTFRASNVIEDLWATPTGSFWTPTNDGDGDGMADTWEEYYFGGTNTPDGGPAEDKDNDRFSNLAEYIAGTSPKNAGDLARLLITGTGGAVRVFLPTIQTGAGYETQDRHYALEFLSGMTGSWTKVGNYSNIPGTNQVIVFTNTPAGAQSGAYRGKIWLEDR